MSNVITIQNVRGYEKDGTVYLNLEDTARGLGFTQEKNGVEYIRFETVNRYLQEFGFSQQVGKDDFIPENIFYRLAMKAKNEVAEKFQAIVADEILPTIRRTGSYSLPARKYDSLLIGANAVADARTIADELQKEFIGLKRGIAISKAFDIASEIHNAPLQSLKELLPPADHDTGFLNATQLGEKLGGIPAKTINVMLANADMQYKEGKDWRITQVGKKYGEEMPYTKNGHSGYQIRWSKDVIEHLKGRCKK